MSDLFDTAPAMRERLKAAGWTGAPVPTRSGKPVWYWKRPDGAVLREEEAFAWLNEQEKEE